MKKIIIGMSLLIASATSTAETRDCNPIVSFSNNGVCFVIDCVNDDYYSARRHRRNSRPYGGYGRPYGEYPGYYSYFYKSGPNGYGRPYGGGRYYNNHERKHIKPNRRHNKQDTHERRHEK